MAQSLYELLGQCTVQVSVPNRSQGTGFFVAPGLILTCAHVVESAHKNNTPVEISWNGQTMAAQIQDFRDVSYSDLALLQVNLPEHPCVLLRGGAEPFSRLYSYGYPDIEPFGASTTFACEGWAGDQQELLKFKEGQVRPGMSGSPLLNEQSGSVCGIVQFTRDRSTDLGGKALLTKVVFREFPQLETQQRQFHQRDKRWAECVTPQQRQALGLVTPADASDAIEVFYSYAEEDEKLVKELQKQLVLLKRLNIITDWYPGKITLEGETPDEQIVDHLNSARIIVLLVSPDFIFSEEHGNFEVEQAMKRHNAKEAVVIPIKLRNIDNWEEMPFGKLQAIPRNNRPVVEWSNRDAAFAEIAKEIRGVVERLKANRTR